MGDGRVTRSSVEVAVDNALRSNVTRITVESASPQNYNGYVTQVSAEVGCDNATIGRATRSYDEIGIDAGPIGWTTRVVTEVSSPGSVTARSTRVLTEIACTGGFGRSTRVCVEVASPYIPDTECEDWLGTRVLSFQELRRRVLVALGEDSTDPEFWTVSEVGRLVNDAYREVVRNTSAVEAIESHTTDGTSAYELDPMATKVHRVFLDDVVIPNVTNIEQDGMKPGWGQDGREVRGYLTSGQNRSVYLDSPPDSGLTLDVWTSTGVEDMSGICDAPSIPAWSHNSIVFLAAAKGLRKHGDQRDTAMADVYADIALEYTSLMKSVIADRGRW